MKWSSWAYWGSACLGCLVGAALSDLVRWQFVAIGAQIMGSICLWMMLWSANRKLDNNRGDSA